ncbi:hypothetical protein ABZ322_21525, partial [Streptomyces sp. NPDC006129]
GDVAQLRLHVVPGVRHALAGVVAGHADDGLGRLFREALGRVLGTWVAEGAWSLTDAQRVAGMLASGNARRVYGLG